MPGSCLISGIMMNGLRIVLSFSMEPLRRWAPRNNPNAFEAPHFPGIYFFENPNRPGSRLRRIKFVNQIFGCWAKFDPQSFKKWTW